MCGTDWLTHWRAQSLNIVDLVFDALFIADLCISFNTGYLIDGYLVTDHRLIAIHYIRGFFLLDLISSFPLGLVLGSGGGSAARLNRLLRLIRLMKLLRLFKFMSFFKVIETCLHTRTSSAAA